MKLSCELRKIESKLREIAEQAYCNAHDHNIQHSALQLRRKLRKIRKYIEMKGLDGYV